MDVTCLSLSRISVVDDSNSDTILTMAESNPSPHVIKIRRPGGADTTNTGKIIRTSPSIKSMDISKSDSNIINGKVSDLFQLVEADEGACHYIDGSVQTWLIFQP